MEYTSSIGQFLFSEKVVFSRLLDGYFCYDIPGGMMPKSGSPPRTVLDSTFELGTSDKNSGTA